MTLLGDAAHPVVPVLGQGGNMAFEDAYELAECLAHAPSLETALCAYERRRIPRTEEIYIHSAIRGARAYKPDNETTIPQMIKPPRMGEKEFHAWLYSYHPSVI